MEGDAPKSKRNTSHRRKLNRSVSQRGENDRTRMTDKGDDRSRQRSSLFDIPNWSEVLDHLRGGELQSIMLNDLNELLSYATEDLLFGFDSPSFLQTLTQLLHQPPDELNNSGPIQNDPNFQMACCDCIHMILDIFPEEAKFFESNPKNFGFITSMLSHIEYVDLGEKLLSIIEKISKECPNVLISSNAIPNMLEYIDFYPIAPQIIAIESISRALSAVSNSNYDEYVKPSLLSISQFILHQNERIRESSLLCFKNLASNAMINDDNIILPCFIFQKMKELIDTEITGVGNFKFFNSDIMNSNADFKISKTVLDVVDISVAFIASSNSSAIKNMEDSGLIESISKLLLVFIPRNYRAANLFAISCLLYFLNELIANIGLFNKRVLDYFDREIINKILSVTKCSLIRSFEHLNKWLDYDKSYLCRYDPVRLPINHMGKQIQLEIVRNGESTRLLSRPFLPFNRIISYIVKNEQVSFPFQLCLNDLEKPIVITVENDELKFPLVELLLRIGIKSIEHIWHTIHVFEIVYPIDLDNITLSDGGLSRLLSFGSNRLYDLDSQFIIFKNSIDSFILEDYKDDDLFDKLVKENTNLSDDSSSNIEMFVIKELADSAMLGVGSWIVNVVSMRPELFSFSLRRLLFYLEGPNLSRSLTYIQNMIKSSLDSRLIVTSREDSSSVVSAIAAFELILMKHYHNSMNNKTISESSEIRMTDRIKVNLDRNNLLRGTAEAFTQINFDTQPIIEFCLVDENGIGTGPTLEVYNLILEELIDKSQTVIPVFSSDVINGLFPAPLNSIKSDDLPFFDYTFQDDGKRILFGWWYFIGQLVACAMIDQRSLDIRLSPIFWSLVTLSLDNKSDDLGERPLKILSLLDYEMAKSLANLKSLSHEQLSEYLAEHGCDDLSSHYKLVVTDHFAKYAVPIFAFRLGFSCVLPLYTLKLFTSTELSEWWYSDCINFDINEARNYIMADHGYTQDSKPFIWLLEVLSELSFDEIRLFLKFCTGSPILPHGGFKNLKPLMCVVKKPIEPNQPYALPSVMTCTNYLKLPDYPNKELLKKMLIYAINEGQNEFELS